jgi:ubiquinone/menaquinone biosynthesis C-methylase UbiE
MENEHSNIHDFDFSLICEYFSGLQRQGPGSPEATLKALSFIDNLTAQSHIADLGCGTGGQTMQLAQHAPGTITGLDLFPDFISQFDSNATQMNLQGRVHGIVGSMDNLPFAPESLDLIWCEGAIYNIGFDNGLRQWKQYLKPGGYLAVTEASWFTDHRPAQIDTFWKEAYAEIDTIPIKVAQLQAAGYVPVAAFILPSECWTKNFYEPQVPLQEAFLKKHAGNKTAEMLVENQRREAELYKEYNAYYGYVFYIGRKI